MIKCNFIAYIILHFIQVNIDKVTLTLALALPMMLLKCLPLRENSASSVLYILTMPQTRAKPIGSCLWPIGKWASKCYPWLLNHSNTTVVTSCTPELTE